MAVGLVLFDYVSPGSLEPGHLDKGRYWTGGDEISDAVATGIIGASAALLGASIGALGGLLVERTRARREREKHLFDRRLDAAIGFLAVAREWVAFANDYLFHRQRRADNPAGAEDAAQAAFGKLRECAERQRRSRIMLTLVGTERMRKWEREDVFPAVGEITKLIGDPSRDVAIGEAAAAVERYRLVVERGVDVCREELTSPT